MEVSYQVREADNDLSLDQIELLKKEVEDLRTSGADVLADELGEVVRDQLSKLAEPIGQKIDILARRLAEDELSDTEVIWIKEEIEFLQYQYMHVVSYNPYSDMTRHERENQNTITQ